MKSESKCETCGILFFRKRRNKNYASRFCSIKCRGFLGFKISSCSKKEKLERLKMAFEKCVVRKDSCWEWKGAKDKNGYARMPCSPKLGAERAHVASYLIHKGSIPKGMVVCHRCDVKECTNPECLFVALPKYNSADMVIKNRQAKGSKNGSAKLNEQKVLDIKKMLESGSNYIILSKYFGVSKDTVWRISKNRTWTHVKD